jgi:plasmid stability protein
MASITIKALPAPLHRSLKSRAARHQRSLNQEVIALLAEGIAPSRKVDVEAMIKQARAFRASLKLKTTPREIDAWKRQGRA